MNIGRLNVGSEGEGSDVGKVTGLEAGSNIAENFEAIGIGEGETMGTESST